MPRAKANGIELEYETFGDPADPPVLLVMGLGAQLTSWDVELCRMLADRGRYVIRFDNRDVGLSTKLEGARVDVLATVASAFGGQHVDAPYTLSDMAADAVGLLDMLGLAAAHVVGASMGGMIVQTLAIEHPDRVLTMTSIMSTTGNRAVGGAQPEAMEVLLNRPPADREGAIEASVVASRIIGSPTLFDEARARRRASEAYDRCFYPEGTGRQLVAIMASGSRDDRLPGVTAPTLVIHGKVDPLVGVSGGERTAELVPGAELLVFDEMGHDLPQPLWPAIVDAIVRHTERVPAAG